MGQRVAQALRKMYQKGLEGEEKYSSEHCREVAQQYLNYAQRKHPRANLSEIKKFVKEMTTMIHEQVESIEEPTKSPSR